MSDPLETRASLIRRLPDPANAAAWDEFATIYAPLVYRMARKQGLQPSDADDVVQEVMASVARSVEAWLARDDRGGFRAWLFRIARNTAVNFLTRHKHRRLGAGGDEVQQWLDQQPAPEETSEFLAEYEREVFRWAAAKVREEVSEQNWLAFWETTMESRPIAEVAEETGMSVGSVYIARSRVMARLRKMVGRYEERDA